GFDLGGQGGATAIVGSVERRSTLLVDPWRPGERALASRRQLPLRMAGSVRLAGAGRFTPDEGRIGTRTRRNLPRLTSRTHSHAAADPQHVRKLGTPHGGAVDGSGRSLPGWDSAPPRADRHLGSEGDTLIPPVGWVSELPYRITVFVR